ncbi:MAG: repressor LexA [Chloroflexi bacterium]|nr:repressor LexA [Chloroflexota bacterium]
MAELGTHEIEIWHYIARYKREHNGCSPTYEQIGDAVGISSKDHVKRDLEKLDAAGYIRLPRGVARGIELLQDPLEPPASSHMIRLPLLGVIHAGEAIPTLDQNITPLEWVQVARNLVGNGKNMYLLQVSGNSMIDALVNDGDTIVMEQTQLADDGDLVAAWLKKKQATTLKRFFRRDGWIVLRPENPTLQEKKYRPSEIEIQGKVVCVIRSNTRPGASFVTRPIRPN